MNPYQKASSKPELPAPMWAVMKLGWSFSNLKVKSLFHRFNNSLLHGLLLINKLLTTIDEKY